MAATIDATLQGASANSYVTLAEADAYFETVPDDSDWTNKTDDKKNRYLISATRYLDGLGYFGTRCSTTQALSWPRKDYTVDTVEIKCTFVPDEIKIATFELARALANNPNALVSTRGTDGVPEEVKLGDLEVKYNTATQATTMVNTIFDVFPWLTTLLSPYCRTSGSNGTIKLER